jgi:hypothetical protein
VRGGVVLMVFEVCLSFGKMVEEGSVSRR